MIMLIYACLGVLIENVFSGARSAFFGDWTFQSQSSLWSFVVWGCTIFVLRNVRLISLSSPGPDSPYLPRFFYPRLFIYLGIIYKLEFTFGLLLHWLIGKVPWDYGSHWYTLGYGSINFLYLPFWLCLCLVFDVVDPYLASLEPQWKTPKKHE